MTLGRIFVIPCCPLFRIIFIRGGLGGVRVQPFTFNQQLRDLFLTIFELSLEVIYVRRGIQLEALKVKDEIRPQKYIFKSS